MLSPCDIYAFTLQYLCFYLVITKLSFYQNYAVWPVNWRFVLANSEVKRFENPEFQAKNQLFSVMNHYELVWFKNNPYLWPEIHFYQHHQKTQTSILHYNLYSQSLLIYHPQHLSQRNPSTSSSPSNTSHIARKG